MTPPAGFTQIPNAVLLEPVLSPEARVLFAILAHHSRRGRDPWPAQSSLAHQLRRSVRMVREYRRELEALELLATQRRGLGQSNLYTLLGQTLDHSSRPAPGFNQDRHQGSIKTGTRVQSRPEAGRRTEEEQLRRREPPVVPLGKGDGEEDSSLAELWSQILTELRREVEDRSFRFWLAPLEPLARRGDELLLTGPVHILAWARDHYRPRIERAASEVLGGEISVVVVDEAGDPVKVPQLALRGAPRRRRERVR